jgi:hypothetical protein
MGFGWLPGIEGVAWAYALAGVTNINIAASIDLMTNPDRRLN